MPVLYRTPEQWGCRRKERFRSKAAALKHGRRMMSKPRMRARKKMKRHRLFAYHCRYCDGWHLSSSEQPNAEQHTGVY